MPTNLTAILKKIFYGSLASIAANNGVNAMDDTNSVPISDTHNRIESLAKKKIDLTPKLLLKRSVDNELICVAHRSHRSHSSHRSHYSSSSGGGSGSYTPPSSNYTPPSRSSTLPSKDYIPPSSLYTPPSTSNSGLRTNSGLRITVKKALQLGARTLKRGMSGTDVTELVNILLKKQYLSLDEGGQATGSYTFDSVVEEAVMQFQTDNGLTSDGVCGPTTIYYLKNK